MQVDLVVIDARALNLWPAHDPITPLPSPRIKVSCRDEDGVDAINTSAYPQVVSRTLPRCDGHNVPSVSVLESDPAGVLYQLLLARRSWAFDRRGRDGWFVKDGLQEGRLSD